MTDEIGWTLLDVIELNVYKLEERKEREVISGDGDNK